MSETSGNSAPAKSGIASAVSQTLLRQILALVVGIGNSVMVARLLGPAGAGTFAVAVLAPTMLTVFLTFGMPVGNIYLVSRGDYPLLVAVRSSTLVALFAGALGVALGLATYHFAADLLFQGVSQRQVYWALASLPISMLAVAWISLLQAVQDFRGYNSSQLASPAVQLVATPLLVYALGLGVDGAVVAFVLGQLTTAVWAYVSLRAHVRGQTLGPNARATMSGFLRDCWRFGIQAHLSNVATTISYRSDVWILNASASAPEVGVYKVAVQLAERIWMVSQALAAVLFPRLAGLGSDVAQRNVLTQTTSRWVTAVAALASLVLAVFSPLFVWILFGAQFSSAVGVLLCLLPGIIAMSTGRIIANDLAARGMVGSNLRTSVVSCVVNVLANFILIPRFGAKGAAMASGISYTLDGFIKCLAYRQVTGASWGDLLVLHRSDLRAAMESMAARGWGRRLMRKSRVK